MNCQECLNLKESGPVICQVEEDALDRLRRRCALPMDRSKKKYFEAMFEIFKAMNESDDDAFYGKGCPFAMAKKEIKPRINRWILLLGIRKRADAILCRP